MAIQSKQHQSIRIMTDIQTLSLLANLVQSDKTTIESNENNLNIRLICNFDLCEKIENFFFGPIQEIRMVQKYDDDEIILLFSNSSAFSFLNRLAPYCSHHIHAILKSHHGRWSTSWDEVYDKMEGLALGSVVKLSGLTDDSYNGKPGIIVSSPQKDQHGIVRVKVNLYDTNKTIKVKPSNVIEITII
jgi:hypothetical protein